MPRGSAVETLPPPAGRRARQLSTILVVWAALASGQAWAGDPHDALEALRQIERFDFEAPEELWRQLERDAPNRAHGLTAAGVLALERGKRIRARQLFAEAKQLKSGSPYPYYYLGRIALEGGNARLAVEELRGALARRGRYAGAYRLLGHAELELGQVEGGLSALRTVIALAPGLAQSHAELGLAQLKHGRARMAAISLERAYELDPTHLEALFSWGYALLNSGEPEAGFAKLEAYVRLAGDRASEVERVERARALLRRYAGL